MRSKIKVSLISTRHCHNSSRTITSQNIISYPNGYFFVGNGMDGISACKYATYTWNIAHTVAFAALGCLRNISSNGVALCIRSNFSYPFVFWSQSQKCNPKKSVSSGGKYFYLAIAIFYWKTNTCTHGFTNPISLHFFEWFGPINFVQSLKQSVGICRNTHAPLLHFLALHMVSASFRNPLNDLVIGKNSTQSRAPIHFCFCQIR